MKKVLTNNVVQNVRKQRFDETQIDHLQAAYQECVEALLGAMNCDPDQITILSGAEATKAGQDFTLTAGWAAYQNEVFQIDAAAFTAPGGEIAVWSIETTYPNTDPVKFSDGSEFNVNEIRKLKLVSGASASGLADWGEVDYYREPKWTDFTLLNGATKSPGAVYPPGHPNPGFRKVNGIVYLRGAIDTSGNGHVATLPDGYRPADVFTIDSARTDGANSYGYINTAGVIQVNDATNLLLDGLAIFL